MEDVLKGSAQHSQKIVIELSNRLVALDFFRLLDGSISEPDCISRSKVMSSDRLCMKHAVQKSQMLMYNFLLVSKDVLGTIDSLEISEYQNVTVRNMRS